MDEQAERRRDQRGPIWLLLAVTLVLVAGLVVANLPEFNAARTRFLPGDVLHVKDGGAEFGVVVSYSASHSFHAGSPVPAYEIRPPEGDDTVWVSEHQAVRTLEKR